MVGSVVLSHFFVNCPYKIKTKNGLEFYKYLITKDNCLFVENKQIAKFNNENDAVLAVACDFFSFICKNKIRFNQLNEPDNTLEKIKFYINKVFLYYFPDQAQFVQENQSHIKIGEIILKPEENVQDMIYQVCCCKFQQRVAAYLEMFC